MMRVSLSRKISFGVATLVVGTTMLVGGIANMTITQAMEGNIRKDLLAGQQVFEEFQRLRFQQLLTATSMVAELPHLKAVVTTPGIDHATILDNAQTVRQIVHSDLFMI